MVARSAVLAAYLAWGGLGSYKAEDAPPRPEGSLVWIHADGADRLPAVLGLLDRLAGEGVEVLLTLPHGTPFPSARRHLSSRLTPIDRPAVVRAFVDHWRPDALIWAGGRLRPALLALADCPKILVDGAPEPQLLEAEARWPGLARAIVPRFDKALVGGDTAAERLLRAGLAEERIEISGMLDAPTPVLPCNERERRDLAQTIGARPVWLAGDVSLAEVPAVVAAHRVASRSAHRLLLILAPRNPEDAQAMARAMGHAGLRVALRADGDEPEEGTQVYLADGTYEMGLWLRLAPLAFLGGTLAGPSVVRNPLEAAALGVALIHGPAMGNHSEAWSRLDTAGAARVVLNGAELGRAVEALLSPDRAATMAHAGWDVATKGAAVSNRVIDLLQEALHNWREKAGPPLGS